jgi:hypothetical protein
MTDTLITRIAMPSDRLLNALKSASPGLAARLDRGEPVVLVVGGAGEGDRIAGAVRDALSERGPGRPRALTDDDVLRAHDLVGAGLSIRGAADELGVSKSALGRALQGYGAGRGAKRKLTDAEVARIRIRRAAGEGVQAIAADLAVSEATVRRALKSRAARKPTGQGSGQRVA